MSNNTQLPTKWQEEIKLSANAFAAGLHPGITADAITQRKK